MRKLILINMLIGLSVLLASCGSTATPAPSASSKPVNITVSANPSPAMMGNMQLVLTVADASGKPIEGARVDVSADHTGMSGMSMGGPATEQGGGRYSIKANFGMSGIWKLTVYVRKDALDYKEEIQFPIQ